MTAFSELGIFQLLMEVPDQKRVREYALAQLEVPPVTLLFFNGGAKLTVEGSQSLEDLRTLEEAGTEILTCGTCLDYYGLKDKLAIGSVTNMYRIAEILTTADRLVTL